MNIFVSAPAPSPAWWETALATLPGQLLVAVLAFTGVMLTLRHSAKLQDRKATAEDRAKQLEAERDAIGKLITTLQPWISGIASWGAAYQRAGAAALMSPNVNEMHNKYTEAATEFGSALSIARVTVRNPAARPALDSLSQERARATGLVSVAMLGKPDPEFAAYFRAIHIASGKALGDLEEAALNWDGSITAPIAVESPTLDATPTQDKGNSTESET
jgi:hypothetical protein